MGAAPRPEEAAFSLLFPEQAANWDFAMERIRSAGRPIQVLNLFAYTGPVPGRGPRGDLLTQLSYYITEVCGSQ